MGEACHFPAHKLALSCLCWVDRKLSVARVLGQLMAVWGPFISVTGEGRARSAQGGAPGSRLSQKTDPRFCFPSCRS